MITSLGAGYALVPVPPDDNPNHGGGPIRKSVGMAAYAQAGHYVHRTPLLVVREAEPGANWPTDLSTTKMFIQDGRLVDQEPYALPENMFHGAPTVIGVQPHSFMYALVPAAAMFAGAGVGYKLSERRPGWGTVAGAVVGGILGMIFR